MENIMGASKTNLDFLDWIENKLTNDLLFVNPTHLLASTLPTFLCIRTRRLLTGEIVPKMKGRNSN